jgi:hypothetical protein
MAHNMRLEKDPSDAELGGAAKVVSPADNVDGNDNGSAPPPAYEGHVEQTPQPELPEDLSSRLSKLNLGQTLDPVRTKQPSSLCLNKALINGW